MYLPCSTYLEKTLNGKESREACRSQGRACHKNLKERDTKRGEKAAGAGGTRRRWRDRLACPSQKVSYLPSSLIHACRGAPAEQRATFAQMHTCGWQKPTQREAAKEGPGYLGRRDLVGMTSNGARHSSVPRSRLPSQCLSFFCPFSSYIFSLEGPVALSVTYTHHTLLVQKCRNAQGNVGIASASVASPKWIAAPSSDISHSLPVLARNGRSSSPSRAARRPSPSCVKAYIVKPLITSLSYLSRFFLLFF